MHRVRRVVMMVVVAATLAATGLVAGRQAAHASGPSSMTFDSILNPGQYLESTNGEYYLEMQGDGNLVLYSAIDYGWRALWSTGTNDRLGEWLWYGNGNLELFDKYSRLRWKSAANTTQSGSAVLQTDGNLVLYEPGPMWSLGTDIHGRILRDANYELTHTTIWYQWGGGHGTNPGPNPGLDCSGFTRWIYSMENFNLGAGNAASQWQYSRSRSTSNPQPGDLVFFGSDFHHVGIYIGNGQMIDELNSGHKIEVDPLSYGGSIYGYQTFAY